MARLPEIPLNVPQVQAPRPPVSPSEIAQPYMELSSALDKTAGALNEASQAVEQNVAEPAAKIAGYQAVTKDDQGNIQVTRMPVFGQAAFTYERAIKMAALADGESVARQDDLALRQKFRDDPEGYRAAAETYRQQKIDQYSQVAGPEVGLAMGRVIGTQTTQTYRGLLSEFENLNLHRAAKSLDSGIQSARDDAVALARGGAALDDPAMQQTFGKIEALTKEKVANPRLAYPQAQADYDVEHFKGELGAERFLYQTDQVYKDKSQGPDGTPNGGYQGALNYARNILTDPTLKLSESQRNAYYNRAVGEVRANEAMRRQDVGMAQTAAQSLRMSSALGLPIQPEDVDAVANAFKAAGSPAGAAKVYADFARKPLNDDFGRQPLPAQIEQLNELHGASRQKGAYEFFVQKGYTPAQAAGIVGGLRGETAGLNATQIHDNGIGFGIAGWNGDRLQALRDYAKAKGADPSNVGTQLSFLDQELRTTESAAGAKLRAAQTPEEAGQAMLSYFRPSNYDVPGAHPERAQYARMAFDSFSGQGAPGASPLATNPAGSLWLQANRARTVDKTAQNSWATVFKDWVEKGIRPNDQAVGQIIDAARATGDHDLLEGISAGMARMNLAQNEATAPLAQQQTDITALHAAGTAGTLSPGQAAVMHDLELRYGAISRGLKENPISTAITNFPDQFKSPLPPLNVDDPVQLQAGLQARARISQFASANWQAGPLPALDSADLNQVKATLQGPDVAKKAQVFQALSGLPDDVRNATLGKLAEKGGPDMQVAVGAGSMLASAPDVATSILRGQLALRTDKAYWPTGTGEAQAVQDSFNRALPPQTFGMAGRTDPQGPYAAAQGMVKARYADLSAAAGDVSGKLSPDRLTQAVNDVTGGVLRFNGQPLLAPARGMAQGDFDRVMAGIGDNDLAGVTTLNGAPVSAAYLKSSGKLVSAGSGRYQVLLNSDPAHPVFAYTGANDTAPQKFVLDLRGRVATGAPTGPNVTQSVPGLLP